MFIKKCAKVLGPLVLTCNDSYYEAMCWLSVSTCLSPSQKIPVILIRRQRWTLLEMDPAQVEAPGPPAEMGAVFQTTAPRRRNLSFTHGESDLD